MQHPTTILTFYLLIAASLCNAMEISTEQQKQTLPKTNILKELTHVDLPKEARYLTFDSAAIANGLTWYFMDPMTERNVRLLRYPDGVGSQLAIHPHQKKFAIYRDKIEISKTKNLKTYFTIKNIHVHLAAFDTSEDTIFLSHNKQLTQYNYENLSYSSIYYDKPISAILCPPTKPFICLANANADITLLNKDTLSEKQHYKNETLNDGHYTINKESIINSPDGPIIPYFKKDKLFIINIDSGQRTQLSTPENNAILIMTSHPNNRILITLSASTSCYILSYWNIALQKLILETSIPVESPHTYVGNNSLSVAPDGIELMVTKDGKSFIVEMPEIITKKRMPHLLFAINNINIPPIVLPTDILQNLKQWLFTLFKH